MVNSQESRYDAGEVHIPMLRVVGVVEPRVLATAASNHVVGRYLSHYCFRCSLQVLVCQIPCALKLAHRGIDTAKSQVSREQVFAPAIHAPARSKPLDAFLNAIDERAVGWVEDVSLLVVLGRRQRRVAVVLWDVSVAADRD